MFLYKNISFQQIDGIFMGLPPGPTIASSFCKVLKLRSVFLDNGYPNYFFDKVLHQFLNSKQMQIRRNLQIKKKPLHLKLHMFQNSLTYLQKIFQNLFKNFLPCPYHQYTKHAKLERISI